MADGQLSQRQEVINTQACLADYGTDSGLGKVTWMVWDGCSPSGSGIPPDFMASLGLTVKGEARAAELSHDLGGREAGQTSHQATPTGILNRSRPLPLGLSAAGNGSPCS